MIVFGITIALVACATIIQFQQASQFYIPEEFAVPEQLAEQAAAVYEAVEETMSDLRSIEVGLLEEPKVRVVRIADNFTLNDKTIDWSRDVHRIWLDNGNLNLDEGVGGINPPAGQILLTNYGWNHPDPKVGLTFARGKRSTKLMEGVVNHPWFHPSAWEQFENNKGTSIDTSIRYYVFLDVETCFESNWPNYASKETTNYDLDHNRAFVRKKRSRCYELSRCRYIQRALEARIFHTPGVKATLVVFDCRGDGQRPYFRHDKTKDSPLAMATMSSTLKQMKGSDMGLAPAAPKPVQLTRAQISDIETCKAETSRSLFLTFVGNFRDKSRQKLKKLTNGEDVLIVHRNVLSKHFNGTFEQLLTNSKFGATPRGDNKFSYRFTEVLSAGAIPVVHANGWVLPFREELVDWTECAVHIPEKQIKNTLEILGQIDDEKRCQMRQRCYEIYDKYMRTHEGTIAGIIEGLELVAESSK